MADTILNTAQGTQTINTDRHVVDMSSSIALLKPRLYPLTVLTKKLNKRTTHNYKFEWLEDSLMARWVSANGAQTNVSTTLALQSNEGQVIAVDDLIKIVPTGEVARVTAVSGDTLTIQRGYGETSAQAISDGDKILVIGNALMQGSGSPAEKKSKTTTAYNYTQIFKTAFSVTGTLDKMKLYGGKELARIRNKKAVEHAQSIEYALLFGERKLDLTGAQPRTTTGGVLRFLSGTSNVDTLDTSVVTDTKLQKKALSDWIEKLFSYGSDRKVWLCSPSVISFVNSLAEDKLQIIQGDNDKTFGLDIVRYQTPHGTLNMIQHPLLVQGYAGYSIALDMENLSYRPLTDRDTKLKTNIQLPDEDGIRDMYITEAGLELKLPETHGMFIIK